jgi:hypothetical protein
MTGPGCRRAPAGAGARQGRMTKRVSMQEASQTAGWGLQCRGLDGVSCHGQRRCATTKCACGPPRPAHGEECRPPETRTRPGAHTAPHDACPRLASLVVGGEATTKVCTPPVAPDAVRSPRMVPRAREDPLASSGRSDPGGGKRLVTVRAIRAALCDTSPNAVTPAITHSAPYQPFLPHAPSHLCYEALAHEHRGGAPGREVGGWTLSR